MQNQTKKYSKFLEMHLDSISIMFECFKSKVIIDNCKISANDIVAIFNGVISKSKNYYLQNNLLVTPFGNAQINKDEYDKFIKSFNENISLVEKSDLAEISDRLIEDTNRRNKGEFYTPSLFVDYAHKLIESVLGPDWRDRFIVWDNCCGTKNLTRDYKFKELYCSTLEKAELDIS